MSVAGGQQDVQAESHRRTTCGVWFVPALGVSIDGCMWQATQHDGSRVQGLVDQLSSKPVQGRR